MSTCKSCGLTIKWLKLSGKWFCHNPDGSDHWDLCSKMRFERIKATGKRFDSETESGYLTDLKHSGVQFTMQTSGVIRGENYVPNECDCVPWEVCDKSPDGRACGGTIRAC